MTMNRPAAALLFARVGAAVALAVATLGVANAADPPGWRLLWSDDFDTLDRDRWEVVHTLEPTNNSLQAYVPEQVSVKDGKLVILSEKKKVGDLAYASGQVVSKEAWTHGRWEVRAKMPTSKGMWPAIWLLPDTEAYPWPSGGEIDIMEFRGNRPTVTSAAFHYGTRSPYLHKYVYDEQHTGRHGALNDYHDGFHTYAVDWHPTHLKFYVDGVHFYTVQDRDVDGFLSNGVDPMQLVINNAIGGDFLPDPDATTQWPQKTEVDWVRVYRPAPETFRAELVNPGFEAAGGSLAGWSVFGDRIADFPNVNVADEAVSEGKSSLKLFGTFSGANSFSGVSQGISVTGGDKVVASLNTMVLGDDSIAKTKNTALMKIEFYSEFDGRYNTEQFLDFRELYFANGWTPIDQWSRHTLEADVPAGAVEARLAIVFQQPADEPGAVHVDDVQFRVMDQAESRPASTSAEQRSAANREPNPEPSAPGDQGRGGNAVAYAGASVAALAIFYVASRVLGRPASSK